MNVTFEAVICLEYNLREGEAIEDLTAEVIDQIRSGEYFASRVKDVQIKALQQAS